MKGFITQNVCHLIRQMPEKMNPYKNGNPENIPIDRSALRKHKPVDLSEFEPITKDIVKDVREGYYINRKGEVHSTHVDRLKIWCKALYGPSMVVSLKTKDNVSQPVKISELVVLMFGKTEDKEKIRNHRDRVSYTYLDGNPFNQSIDNILVELNRVKGTYPYRYKLTLEHVITGNRVTCDCHRDVSDKLGILINTVSNGIKNYRKAKKEGKDKLLFRSYKVIEFIEY